MGDVPANFAQRVYAYRSFEHSKRTTFSIIVSIAREMNRPLRVVDLSCGPGVLCGILCEQLKGSIESMHLIDYDARFLEVAQHHLAPLNVPMSLSTYDVNNPGTYPAVKEADLVVSTNALFHAAADNLPHVYAWAFKALKAGGLLINHQTFGLYSEAGAAVYEGPVKSLTDKAVLDPLERELNRISHLDARKFNSPEAEGTGRYAGLHLPVEQHLRMLSHAGFVAEEVWRAGRSAMIVALKR